MKKLGKKLFNITSKYSFSVYYNKKWKDLSEEEKGEFYEFAEIIKNRT